MNNSLKKQSTVPAPTIVTVMIVDSDTHHRQSLSRGLSIYGYNRIALMSCAEALDFLQGRGCSGACVLLVEAEDLPVAELQALHTIQQHLPELAIIGICGFKQQTALESLVEKGMLLLKRPFSPTALDEKIQAIFK